MYSSLNKVLLLPVLAVAILEFSLILFLANPTKAAGTEVKLSATVMPLPPSATINDFDFSQINPAGEGKVYL
ncbi:MAG: hypothetical protein WCP91_00220 [Candidatus Berkelbacteria bacterium]